jgi:hypothetical protein
MATAPQTTPEHRHRLSEARMLLVLRVINRTLLTAAFISQLELAPAAAGALPLPSGYQAEVSL